MEGVVAEGPFAVSGTQPIHTQLRAGLLHERQRSGGRRPFTDTETFKARIMPALDEAQRRRPLREVEGLPAALVNALGAHTQVQQALAHNERDLMRRTGLSRAEVAAARRRLLALPPRGEKAAK